MIEINVPGYRTLEIAHLVLDFNGTLAVDGRLLPGVKESLNTLADSLDIHVLTADTFGHAAAELEGIRCSLHILPARDQDMGKLDYVREMDPGHTASIGNGRNDSLMLKASALGIAVILGEGAALDTVSAADVVCTDILSALSLLTHPLRLVATLRT